MAQDFAPLMLAASSAAPPEDYSALPTIIVPGASVIWICVTVFQCLRTR